MSNPSFSTGFRNALLDGTDVTTMFDGGVIELYDGTQPADADATEVGAGTLIAEIDLPLSNAFAASASGGSISGASFPWTETSALAASVTDVTWFRLYDVNKTKLASTTAIRIDGDVTTLAVGTGDLTMTTTDIASGDEINIDSFSLSITLAP